LPGLIKFDTPSRPVEADQALLLRFMEFA